MGGYNAKFGGGGGQKQAPPSDDRGFLGDLVHGGSNVLRSVAQMGMALGREPGEIWREVFQEPITEDLPEAIRDIRAGRFREAFMGDRSGAEVLEETAKAPGVRFLPFAYVGENVAAGTPRELLENPAYTLLDVLPGVGKAVKTGVRGTRLAGEAAESARLAGRPGKALRITEGDIRLHETAMAVARRGEKRLPEAVRPSRVLERHGLGGVRARGTSQRVARQEKLFRADLADDIAPILGREARSVEKALGRADIPSLSQQYGVTPERMRELTRLADEGAPGWREAIQPNETAFLQHARALIDELTDVGPATGKQRLFEFRGEVYGPEASALRGAIKRFDRSRQKVERYTDEVNRGVENAQPKLQRAMREQNQAAVRVEQLHSRRPPARFQTALEGVRRQRLADKAREKLPPGPELDEALTAISEGFRRIPGISRAQVSAVVRETNRTWQQLKKQGFDPEFIPHVSAEQAARLGYPKLVSDRLTVPSVEKARGSAPKPWEPNIEVAISYTAYEQLGRIHTERLINTLDEAGILGSTEAVEQAARQLGRSKGVPSGDMQKFVQDFIRDNYDTWSPESIFPMGKFNVAGVTPSYLVPKGVGDVISKMKLPPNTLGGKLARGANETLRTSVLDLNPMYYIGNSITALTRQLIKGNPADLRYFPNALRMIARGEFDPLAVRGGRMQAVEHADRARWTAAGRTLGRIAREADGTVGKTRSGVDKVFRARDTLRNLSGMIDDAGRAVAYLAEESRALKRGFTKSEARDLAMEHAGKVLNGFDDMVPLERAIIRNVFPFYGWYRFIAGTVMTYPFDHPLRATVIMGAAREIEDDWHDGLPERFRGYFFFGDPTRTPPGKIKGMSATFALPELGVANLFTLGGLLQRMGPQWQALMRLAGGDEFAGGPELYPNMRYNPVTGQDEWDRPSTARIAAESFVPQAGAVMDILKPGELERLRSEDPETYWRLIRSNLGVNIPYDIDIQEQITKSRERQQRDEERQRRQEQESSPSPAVSSGTGSSGFGAKFSD